jgi:hypothetical protein
LYILFFSHSFFFFLFSAHWTFRTDNPQPWKSARCSRRLLRRRGGIPDNAANILQ